MTGSAEDVETVEHTFEECPDCGGELTYPVKGYVECEDCDEAFAHEIRGDDHLLWGLNLLTGHYEEVVKRA